MSTLYSRADIGGFPFNSVSGDRAYDASYWRDYFGRIIANGVFPVPTGQLLVTPGTGMAVSVAAGACYIGGVSASCAAETLGLPVGDAALPRVDRVVLRLDQTDRTVYLGVRQGTPASTPAAPDLERDADVWELALADLAVPAGALAVTPSMVLDRRSDRTVCGFVSGAIASVDVEALPPYLTGGVVYVASANGGTATALTATVDALGMAPDACTAIRIVPAADCGVAPTLAINGGTAYPIHGADGQAASFGQLRANVPVDLVFYSNKYFFKSGGVRLAVYFGNSAPSGVTSGVWVKTAISPTRLVLADHLYSGCTVSATQPPTNDMFKPNVPCCTDGTNIYGGSSGTGVFRRYEPATNTVTTLANMLESRSTSCTMSYPYLDGCVYVFPSASSNKMYQYTIATNTWAQVASPVASVTGPAASVVVYHGKIHNFMSTVHEVYDPATDTWTNKAAVASNGYMAVWQDHIVKMPLYKADNTANYGYWWDEDADTWNSFGITARSQLYDAIPTSSVILDNRLLTYVGANNASLRWVALVDPRNGNSEVLYSGSDINGNSATPNRYCIRIGDNIYLPGFANITGDARKLDLTPAQAWHTGDCIVLCRGNYYGQKDISAVPTSGFTVGVSGVFYEQTAGTPVQELETYVYDSGWQRVQ